MRQPTQLPVRSLLIWTILKIKKVKYDNIVDGYVNLSVKNNLQF